jgi:hypothetical protein
MYVSFDTCVFFSREDGDHALPSALLIQDFHRTGHVEHELERHRAQTPPYNALVNVIIAVVLHIVESQLVEEIDYS